MPRDGARGSCSDGAGPGKVNALLVGVSPGPAKDAFPVFWELEASCTGILPSARGPEVASVAVAVGAVVLSADPKLDKLTGLVCMLSTVTCSGITMLLATFCRGSLIWFGAGGASFGRLMAVLSVPRRL